MDNVRKAMIEELMLTLKIPQGSFNFGTIADEIVNIPNDRLKEFYKGVVSADNYGNGMKIIAEVAGKHKVLNFNDFSEAAQNLGNVLRRRGNTEEYILEMMIEWDED
jgi:hypothetical protein